VTILSILCILSKTVTYYIKIRIYNDKTERQDCDLGFVVYPDIIQYCSIGGFSLKILAIDTSTLFGGVAVYDDETDALSEHRVGGSTRQFSESLMDMIDLCLKNLSLTMDDIDCLAVTAGPGSFTGLRVGLATVKGLAYATGKPVVAVSTLLVHSWSLPFHEAHICPLLDARKKEVYSAIYAWKDDDLEVVMEEGVYTIQDVVQHIDRETIFIGDGLAVYRERIVGALGDRALFAPANMNGGLPSTLARLAAIKARNKEFADIATVSPVYFRKSEAELKSR
jgi:tRNA threonylcarbamoyladenosine biosynthesis protein TsaB